MLAYRQHIALCGVSVVRCHRKYTPVDLTFRKQVSLSHLHPFEEIPLTQSRVCQYEKLVHRKHESNVVMDLSFRTLLEPA
jgi:hypothetical protein